jgi:phosphohistidine phosphatase
MELYLLRHAIAADAPPPGGSDADRALTADGIAKMKAAARGMRRLGIQPDVLLSSPLLRAQQTAEIAAQELGLEVALADELTPGCDLAALAALLRAHPRASRPMIVGHEPDFSGLIRALTGGAAEMKKGGLARIDADAIEPGAGRLIFLLPPRVLRAIG